MLKSTEWRNKTIVKKQASKANVLISANFLIVLLSLTLLMLINLRPFFIPGIENYICFNVTLKKG